MSSETNVSLTSEDVEKGSQPEGTIGAAAIDVLPNASFRSSSASSLGESHGGTIRSEEPNVPVVRSSTPPPSSGMNEDGLFKNKDGGDVCPPSPSGLRWRPAGATFNPYPNTLIEDRGKVRMEKLDDLPRLVDRNRAFHQSSNKVHLRHNQGINIYRLLRFNWFHVFLRWPTKYSFFFLMSVWTGIILVFAVLYALNDEMNRGTHCVLGGLNGEVISFGGAFAHSLQTCSAASKDFGKAKTKRSCF
jgi:hypothetical protein